MRLAAALLSAAVTCPAALAAQIPGIAPGDTVRFTSRVPWTALLPPAQRRQSAEDIAGWRVAAVTAVTPDSLLAVVPRADVPLAIHLDSIYALDVSRGRQPRMARLRTWGTIGVIAGVLVGALTADQNISSVGPRMALGAALGLGTGAAISAAQPGPYRWVQVRIPACRPRPGLACLNNAAPPGPPR